MSLITEDPALGGAPRFRGTPVPVQPVANLLRKGVSEAMVLADFPS